MEVVNINDLTAQSTLASHNGCQTTCLVFEEESAIPQRTYRGMGTLQVVCGEVEMHFVNGESYTLRQGDYMPFDARVDHYVIAKENTKALLTIQEC
ncbi:cupin domain-containing protein [Niameybacter massiliensis]|uniref:Cupin domain-containing protein n=1 Tax=Holtiella tumoricola TaxID=3018743 RepID=A0AA42DQA9_9FIRM|nr:MULTISPECIES: cupin domain-containing protein [Lachnospirales]MDA3733305.1 cupin domain-containing protein [Holtiella tumoricola]